MYKGTKCLVTGGTGMIGRKVCDLLVEQGAKVTSVSWESLKPNSQVNYIALDLANYSPVRELVNCFDYIFHCAGVKGNPKVTEEKPASFFVPIVQINTNVFEACRQSNVRGVVYTSSKAIYEYEKSYAGWAKMTGEKQIETYRKQYGDKRFHIIRLHNVFGEGDNFDPESAMVIPSLMAKMARGDNPIEVWGDGSDIRSFAYSGDVAQEILDAIPNGNPERDFRGIELTIGELVGFLSWLPYKMEEEAHPNRYSRYITPDDVPGVYKHFRTTKPLKDVESRTMDNELCMKFERQLLITYRWFLEHRDEYKAKKDYFR